MPQHCWKRYLLCVVFIFFSPLAFAQQSTMKDIAVATVAKNTTQLILTFDKPTAYKILVLTHPDRLVMDMRSTNNAFKNDNKLDFNLTPITHYRHGIQHGIDLRLVFDLHQPVQIVSSVVNGRQYQLIVTLTTSGTQKIPSLSSALLPTVKAAAGTISVTHVAMASHDATSREIESHSMDFMENQKHAFVVVIDAGHGGKDPGTMGPDGTQEKNVTLAIANDLKTLINAQPNMHAVMTRNGDYYVGLRQRLMLARQAKGDIFIAIHADAYKDPYAQGASVFALSLHGASSEAGLWLAKKENYSELGGINLNGIQDQDAQIRSVLIDLSQTATIAGSLQFGKAVIQQLGEMTSLHHGFVEQAPFMVLKSPDIPSILVETGFLSNPKEEGRLSSASYQQAIAHALLKGITQYYTGSVPNNLPVLKPH